MSKKMVQKESKKTTLARVKEEMAAPRMAKSARDENAIHTAAKGSGQNRPKRVRTSA